jgi:molybdopterin converting factor small subunit
LNESANTLSVPQQRTQTVVVRLFAGAAEIAAARSLSVQVTSQACVADIAAAVVALEPRLANLVAISRWAVGNAFIDSTSKWPPATTTDSTPEIAMIPPVSGG